MRQEFPMVPAANGPVWFAIGFGVFMLALVGLFGYLAYSSRNVRFGISPEGLRIAGDLYGRTIPLAALEVDRARIVDLSRERELQATLRTNGTALPGYSAGWFRLRNKEKALLFITDPTRVVYLPTRKGYSVLMSTPEPEGLLEALRRQAG